jgi:hypothetical protein
MDEGEWLACEYPELMMDFHVRKGMTRKLVLTKGTERKLRLFACGCCRRVWDSLLDERSRNAVEAAEKFVEARTNEERRLLPVARRAAVDAEKSLRDHASRAARATVGRSSFVAGSHASVCAARVIAMSIEERDYAERAVQAHLLRDIFGNPFHLVSLDPAWRTPVVLALAQAAYDNRILPAGTLDPDRLAVLSDALEEAGCGDADILAHLRRPGQHVRGCWVVDAILGKK